MLNNAIGDLLPSALAVALSPIPIVAIVLVLGAPNARTAGPAFAVGWIAGLLCVSVIVVLLVGSGRRPRQRRPGPQLAQDRDRDPVPPDGRQAVDEASEGGRGTRDAELDGHHRHRDTAKGGAARVALSARTRRTWRSPSLRPRPLPRRGSTVPTRRSPSRCSLPWDRPQSPARCSSTSSTLTELRTPRRGQAVHVRQQRGHHDGRPAATRRQAPRRRPRRPLTLNFRFGQNGYSQDTPETGNNACRAPLTAAADVVYWSVGIRSTALRRSSAVGRCRHESSQPGVAEELGGDHEVGPAAHERGGERVPEHVRGDVVVEPGASADAGDHVVRALDAQPCTSPAWGLTAYRSPP